LYMKLKVAEVSSNVTHTVHNGKGPYSTCQS
jgi:hypothetical protein